MIKHFSAWLASTTASGFIGNHAWITPIVQTIHILAIAALSGAVLMVSARLVRISGSHLSVSRVDARFGGWFWWALLALLLTGAVLVVGEPDRELLNNLFRAKMLMVLATAVLFWLFHRRLRASPGAWDGASGRLLAAAFVLLWLLIVTAGRWIAYV